MLAASHAVAEPRVTITGAYPCFLYEVGTPVRLHAKVQDVVGDGEAALSIVDYDGRPVWSGTAPFKASADKAAAFTIEPGTLPAGYYELTVKAATPAGQALEKASFAVVHFTDRTAKQTREGNYRFGVKKWNFGVASWKNNAAWNEEETIAATAKLGLQWTREIFNLPDHLGVVEMVTKYPMNAVLKVERFPAEFYDADKYGPMDQWEAKFGRGAWALKTLPREKKYKAWLATQIDKIPADQKVFEVWNEAWDKMSAEDFAVLCRWVSETILARRPDAIIGPNLLGEISPYQFDARLIKAGGMKGMKMVALHPYGATEDRAWLREYRRWLREQLGHDVQIYVTEFGASSVPEGPAKKTEKEQAQIVVRHALALFAEGVTAFMPHTMGQPERSPTYIEDWFGQFRFNRQPKPVVVAYANAAHLIDGGRYVGDLWYGPGVEALLFEKDGQFVVSLQTRGPAVDITVAPGVSQLTRVDMVGKPAAVTVTNNRLPLTVGPDVTWLVGVSPQLEQSASTELRPDRWPAPAKPPRTERVAARLKVPPTLDGKTEDWHTTPQIALLNPKVNPEDGSGFATLGWDEHALYVAVQIRDNEILNTRPLGKIYQQDSLELFVSTEPREKNAGYGPHDRQLFITPTSASGQPLVGVVTDREAGKVEPVADAKFFAGKLPPGWAAEVAIPWSTFGDFRPKPGAKLALEMRLNDADTAHERFKIDPPDGNVLPPDPTAWSYLTLGN